MSSEEGCRGRRWWSSCGATKEDRRWKLRRPPAKALAVGAEATLLLLLLLLLLLPPPPMVLVLLLEGGPLHAKGPALVVTEPEA